MTTDHGNADVAEADPRHRSFHLTRPAPALAEGADPSEIASGWVRILGSNGTPVAVRITSITQVTGPYELNERWIVRLHCPGEDIEPIGFDTQAGAETFVEDLLHDV